MSDYDKIYFMRKSDDNLLKKMNSSDKYSHTTKSGMINTIYHVKK